MSLVVFFSNVQTFEVTSASLVLVACSTPTPAPVRPLCPLRRIRAESQEKLKHSGQELEVRDQAWSSPQPAIDGGTSGVRLKHPAACLRMGPRAVPPAPGHPVKRGRRATLETEVVLDAV